MSTDHPAAQHMPDVCSFWKLLENIWPDFFSLCVFLKWEKYRCYNQSLVCSQTLAGKPMKGVGAWGKMQTQEVIGLSKTGWLIPQPFTTGISDSENFKTFPVVDSLKLAPAKFEGILRQTLLNSLLQATQKLSLLNLNPIEHFYYQPWRCTSKAGQPLMSWDKTFAKQNWKKV